MKTLLTSSVAACALLFASTALAQDSAAVLDTKSRAALDILEAKSPAARALAPKAAGILVFPSVYKVGIGIGGGYGEGALFVGGNEVGFYNIASASIGLQLGAQKQSVAIMFLTPEALHRFQRSNGWRAGVDGTIAVVDAGAGGSIDSNTLQQPIVGFVFDNSGLMAGLTLEGSKITPIRK